MAKKRMKKGASIDRIPHIPPAIFTNTLVKITDNSGGQTGRVIGVLKKKTVRRRLPGAAVGDVVVVSIREGKPELRRQIMHAIVVRQRKPYRRADGTWIQFEDNAVILITPEGEPRGTEIRGPVAKEAAEKWPKIANIASLII
ncbi:MAG: 50S ribosomal protein L14 [Thermoprotei archaeon]|nr:MAG: 50S ribosomal protein L14 [Thermoprotei archaeon]RLF03610.1 MAG: 50S ribosomal protein L14 [Thermoprotei archaeon]